MIQRTFSEEFKREAVKLSREREHSIAHTAKELGIGKSTLRKWIKLYGGDETPGVSINKDEQIRQLQKENRRLKMEQEILKKATAFFAKDQL